jgi:hypothetical protein
MNRCETGSGIEGRCQQTATHRLDQTAAGVTALACDAHTAMWMRTKRVRGVVVRVHPAMVATPLGR